MTVEQFNKAKKIIDKIETINQKLNILRSVKANLNREANVYIEFNLTSYLNERLYENSYECIYEIFKQIESLYKTKKEILEKELKEI